MDTPISFGTDGWRATLDEFTSPRVQIVGQAVSDYLREVEDRAGETVAVSYDARETSRGFAEDLCRVLAANGFDVIIPERDTPTPILAWTLVDRDLAGGLMITASHNPPEYNGVKFIPSDGAPALPEVTDEIMARLAEPDPLPESEHGQGQSRKTSSPRTPTTPSTSSTPISRTSRSSTTPCTGAAAASPTNSSNRPVRASTVSAVSGTPSSAGRRRNRARRTFRN